MLMNSTLTQIFVILTTFILCFLSKYFYTKAKEKEINIVIRATRGYHSYRKKMELYTVTFSLLGIILFSYFIYISILDATLGGSWIWAYVKIIFVFTVVILLINKKFIKNELISGTYIIIILGTIITLYLLYWNQHIFKDMILKMSEKPIFMHIDLWIITYVLIFFTMYFFKLKNQKKNKKYIFFGTIFLVVSIIACCYFYYLMIKSAVEGRSYISTLMQMIIFSDIGGEIYLYKKDKLFNMDYRTVSILALLTSNALVYAVSIVVYYIMQGKISIHVINVG